MPRLDSLFNRPRPMRVALQKFFIVIGLDHQRAHLAQPLDDHLGHITEIGDKPEAACAGLKDESQRINRVMRDRKCLHGDVANRKLGAGSQKFASFDAARMSYRYAPLLPLTRCNRSGHQIFRQRTSSPQMWSPCFVREEDAIELLRHDAALLQTQYQCLALSPPSTRTLQ